jgi:hypothetical protein
MITWNEMERMKREAAMLRYNTHMSVVLSLVLSLAAVGIISKSPVTNVWLNLAAFILPTPIVFYFKNRLVLLGPVPFVGALLLTLGAAALFGI